MNLSHLPIAYAERVAATAKKNESKRSHLALFHFDGKAFITEVESLVILVSPSFRATKALVEAHNQRVAEGMFGEAQT